MSRLGLLLGWMVAGLGAPLLAADLKVSQEEGKVVVTLDGQFFAQYLIKSGAKPIIWPIVGPNGKEMTRGYPMRDAIATEKKDHIHHRSFWFTHGDVNGVSFWDEQGGNGEIIHKEFLKVKGGEQAVISTRNEWIGPDKKKHCEDIRTFTFGGDKNIRWVDAEVTVLATHGPVKFGDTKEGCFGLRVAGSMRTELKKGGKILNSEQQTDAGAWGKPAAWVDYSGPVEGQTAGVAIFNHPSSFRFPTYWHVRTYGLFAANPFGLHNFIGKEKDGSHSLKQGESFTLKYRVYFHKGDAEEGRVAEAYKAYATAKKR
ncbi:MAG: PmoA family protein [Pirellulaceae bacterium]|nr:PmoA family protein [Pirellulaceae bacterium]